MATLIYTPIVHYPGTDEELLEDKGRRELIDGAAEFFWRDVMRKLDGRRIDRVYQDSYTGENLDDLIADDPYNMAIVEMLTMRGASLERTESREVIDECDLLLECGFDIPYSIPLRDRHAAAQVNATLRPGETGIMFMGAEHNVPGELDRSRIIVELCNGPLHQYLSAYNAIFPGISRNGHQYVERLKRTIARRPTPAPARQESVAHNKTERGKYAQYERAWFTH